MANSAAAVTVLAPTAAEPDNATFSAAAVSSTLSARAVKPNEPEPLNAPAGIDTVNRLAGLVRSVQKSSPDAGALGSAANTAPSIPDPPATVTVTSVAAARSEAVPAKVAVTVIFCEAVCSNTAPGDTDNVTASSSSTNTRSAAGIA